MTRNIIKLAIHSYIISSFIYRIEKYVKDKWGCRKSAAMHTDVYESPFLHTFFSFDLFFFWGGGGGVTNITFHFTVIDEIPFNKEIEQ